MAGRRSGCATTVRRSSGTTRTTWRPLMDDDRIAVTPLGDYDLGAAADRIDARRNLNMGDREAAGLRAEIERLRTALQKIADEAVVHPDGYRIAVPPTIRAYAQGVLARG